MIARIKYHIVPSAVFAVFAFILSLMTHFGFFSNTTFRHDAGIFAYIGYAMKSGRVLYTQVWENKGPLLYFINMLGVSLNYRYGIAVIEIILFFISLFIAYKISLIIITKNRIIAVTSAVFSMLMLIATLEGGNLAEEYAIPFVCGALYFVTKFFYNEYKLRMYESIIFGMCLSAVFLIRANICAFLMPMVIFMACTLFKQRNWKELLKSIALTILGIVLFALPFLIYLIANGALEKCLSDVYFNVLGNFEPLPFSDVLKNVYQMILNTAKTGSLFVFVIFIVACIVIVIRGKVINKPLKYMLGISFCGLFLNLAANSLSGAMHMHYFMTFVPILIIPSVYIFNAIYLYIMSKKQGAHRYIRKLAVCGIVLFVLYSVNLVISSTDEYINFDTTQADVIEQYVTDNSTEADLVQVIGDVTLNYRTKRLTASRHLHFAAGRFSDSAVEIFANEIAEDINKELPELIMFTSDREYNRLRNSATILDIEEFLLNNYGKQEVEFNYIVYKKRI